MQDNLWFRKHFTEFKNQLKNLETVFKMNLRVFMHYFNATAGPIVSETFLKSLEKIFFVIFLIDASKNVFWMYGNKSIEKMWEYKLFLNVLVV